LPSLEEVQPESWRLFHAHKFVEMVTQAYMQVDYTMKGMDEREERWSSHKFALDSHQVNIVPRIWDGLDNYVITGTGLI